VGGVFFRDHVLQYHPFLRKHFTSRLNTDFLTALLAYSTAYPRQKVAVAIDHQRLMPKTAFRRVLELDRWYGSPFCWSHLDDRNHVGVTVHWRRPDPVKDLTDPLERTEFMWSHKNEIKTVQIEEIHRSDAARTPVKGYVLNRYTHAVRDIRREVFVHLDGSVKVYTGDGYAPLSKRRWPASRKAHHKAKVFRIDGDIPNDHWEKLATYFFRQNEMVVEYFSTHDQECSETDEQALGLP